MLLKGLILITGVYCRGGCGSAAHWLPLGLGLELGVRDAHHSRRSLRPRMSAHRVLVRSPVRVRERAQAVLFAANLPANRVEEAFRAATHPVHVAAASRAFVAARALGDGRLLHPLPRPVRVQGLGPPHGRDRPPVDCPQQRVQVL